MAETRPTHKLVAIRNGIPHQTLYIRADDADDLDNAIDGFALWSEADSVAGEPLSDEEADRIESAARALAEYAERE